MDTNVLTATLAAMVSFVVTSLGFWWQARGRRIERSLDRLQSQINEFYGPLLGLVEEYLILRDCRDEILAEASKTNALSGDQQAKFKRFIYKNHLFPIHNSIRTIIDERLHLLDEGEVPASFRAYLRSSIQEMIQYEFWATTQTSLDFCEGRPFPVQFEEDVRSRLKLLLERQQKTISGWLRRWSLTSR